MPEETLTGRLADFIRGLSDDDLNREQVRKLKTYFLDWLGSALAGGTQKPVRIMADVVQSLGGRPEATIIPDSTRTSCLLASLVNGASTHVVEMDDLHRESVFHPAAPIMPAVFAAAERGRASGRDLLTAIAAGYEIGIRVAVAVGLSHYHYWHTTATCGVFGAAAGAAKILGLNQEQTVWALGSAGTQAAGLWEFLVESAMSKQLHPAKAAADGLLAALLAQKGFTGAGKILEGEKGFFQATSNDFDLDRCVKDLGREFLFERNSLKYYASCGHTHSAVEAVLRATGGRSIKPEEVKRVTVRVYQQSLDLLEKVEPNTPYVAKFSLPFCVASALRFGRVGLQEFTAARIKDTENLELMLRIKVEADPDLTRAYPVKWPARVEILYADGSRAEGASDYPKGDPENPLTDGELRQKFRELTAGVLDDRQAGLLIDRAMDLDKISDVSTFFSGVR